MSSFPLLRLPYVALTEVLRCLDPIELFIFAQASTKAFGVVSLVKSKSFRIVVKNEFGRKVTINNHYRFSLEKKFYKDQFVDFKCRSVDFSVKREGQYKLRIFSDYEFEPFIWYFCKLFNTPIRGITFLPIKDFDQVSALLIKIGQTKNEIEEVEICRNKMSSEITKKTLDLLQKTNLSSDLCFKPTVPRGFVYNFGKLPERLRINDSHWFTMENLMQARNCAHIDLDESSLTIQNMREFINLWKQGEFPNLEYFQASRDSFNLNAHPEFEDRWNTERHRKRIKNCYYTRSIINGVKVQRDNGQKAEYCIHGNWFQFFVRSEWDMY